MPPFLLAALPPLCMAVTVSEAGTSAVRLQNLMHLMCHIPADARSATCHHDRAALHTSIRIHPGDKLFEAMIHSSV